MRWADPDRLYLLWLVLAAVVFLVWIVRRRRALEASLGETDALRKLTGESGRGPRFLRTVFLVLAFALALAGVARPQAGFRLVTTTSRGADVAIAFDVSHSMEARDVHPDREHAAEREILTLLDALEGSSIGLVVFAGEARVVSPLSTDREGLASMVETVRSDDAGQAGSDLGAAIALAARLLHRPGERPHAVVLVSDGENLQGDPQGSMSDVRGAGARLFTIGVGTPEGSLIPIIDSTGAVVGQRREADGSPVVTHLDEKNLRELARRGGGRYERGDGSGRAALRIADAIRSGGGEEVRGQSVRAYDERYPWFAAVACLCLLAERAVPRRKTR